MKQKPLKGLTIAAYAKLRGQSVSTVRRKLKQAGLTGLIDPQIADPLLAASMPANYKAEKGGKLITSHGAEVSYNEAERRLKLAKAVQEELKLKQIEGELVRRDAVAKAVFEQGRRVRDGLENLPARLSGIFAAEHDQARIFALFSAEIQQCLEGLTA